MPALHLFILLSLSGACAMLRWNLRAFHTVAPAAPPASEEAPLISILIPARNEALRVTPCAVSLAKQEYPHYEVLFLDDQSDDGTSEVLRQLGYSEAQGARLRLLHGTPLPEGWTGKGWACHQLAAAARGEYLLFLDADTEHTPQMLASLLAHARATRASLLSAWPHLITRSWSERLILPLLPMALTSYPHAWLQRLQADPARAARFPRWLRRGLGAANGQCLFFERAAYDKIGGHAAVKHHLVEDVALGREVTLRIGEGLRLINANGRRISRVRMYTRFSEVWEGFTKNIRAAFENSLWLYLCGGVWTVLVYLLPFALAITAFSGWVAMEVGLIYLLRAMLARAFRTSWVGALFHPVALGLMVLIALNSWRRSAGSGVFWKGRRYAVTHSAND